MVATPYGYLRGSAVLGLRAVNHLVTLCGEDRAGVLGAQSAL
jgi:hypothetical protein